MKTPYLQVKIGELDISSYIESFKYEDCLTQDDMVELKIMPKYAKEFDEDEELVIGKVLTFQFGYMGLELSKVHQARITDVDFKYDAYVSISVRALDMGTVMKKTSSTKVWQNKTTKQIVTEIAALYNMAAECEIDGNTWVSEPQGNLSDYEFLQRLALKEDDYIIYVKNNTIHFKSKSLDKKATHLFTYGDGNTVISFSPKSASSTASKEGISNKIIGVDGLTKQTVVNEASRGEGATLNGYVAVYDENSNRSLQQAPAVIDKSKLEQDSTGAVGGVGNNLVMPTDGANSALAKSNAKKKDQDRANLKIEGTPFITVNEVVTMAGVFKRHAGNWYVEKVTHNINGSGYLNDIELTRNGAKTGTVVAINPNKTVGTDPKNKSTEVEIKAYNANAEIL